MLPKKQTRKIPNSHLTVMLLWDMVKRAVTIQKQWSTAKMTYMYLIKIHILTLFMVL